MSGLYRLTTKKTEKPVVLMLYGPSGVGKTESAKSISQSVLFQYIFSSYFTLTFTALGLIFLK